MTTGLVHQVEADDDAIGDLEDLEHQVEVSFESGGIHHHQRDVRLAEEDEVAGDFLVGASRLQ